MGVAPPWRTDVCSVLALSCLLLEAGTTFRHDYENDSYRKLFMRHELPQTRFINAWKFS
jgi:hypothetical protein